VGKDKPEKIQLGPDFLPKRGYCHDVETIHQLFLASFDVHALVAGPFLTKGEKPF